MSPDGSASGYERIRAEVGAGVTVVAATKYVSVEDMAVLAEAGVEVVGENRAQDLEAKHARYGAAFRWHFIGHLQSRKAPVVSELCELVPLARVRVRRAPADDPRARRGEPLRRADEVRHRARGAAALPRAVRRRARA